MPTIGLEYRYPFINVQSWGTQTIEPIAQIILRPNEPNVGKIPNEDAQSLVFDDTYQHEAWNETDETRVVLFVDVVRPLREPMRTFNAAVIKVIGWSPFIQDAKRRHREWERRFASQLG